MSAFVLSDEGVVINRIAAQQGKVPLAAWDLGSFEESTFLSTQPDPALELNANGISAEDFEGTARQSHHRSAWTYAAPWQLSGGLQVDQIIVATADYVVGQVNRRAAAILAPLLKAGLIGIEVKFNQEADGRRCKTLYVYALLGERGNSQVVREPRSIAEMRAYIALLACTMKALNAVEGDPDNETEGATIKTRLEEGVHESNVPWDRLPGAASWDSATGSIGNIVSKDLINQLGSRTFACLRSSGAELSKSKAS